MAECSENEIKRNTFEITNNYRPASTRKCIDPWTETFAEINLIKENQYNLKESSRETNTLLRIKILVSQQIIEQAVIRIYVDYTGFEPSTRSNKEGIVRRNTERNAIS